MATKKSSGSTIKFLIETHPEIAAEFHPDRNGKYQLEELRAKHTRRIWWRCEHGHVWNERIVDRVGGHGCAVCLAQQFSLPESPRIRIRSETRIVGVQFQGLKGFSHTETRAIPLRPLTLVFGANNSGKSTILKGIANIAQTIRQNKATADISDWWESGEWFDFGPGRSVLHNGDGNEFSIAFDLIEPGFTHSSGEEFPTFCHRIRYQLKFPHQSIHPTLHRIVHDAGPTWTKLERHSSWTYNKDKPTLGYRTRFSRMHTDNDSARGYDCDDLKKGGAAAKAHLMIRAKHHLAVETAYQIRARFLENEKQPKKTDLPKFLGELDTVIDHIIESVENETDNSATETKETSLAELLWPKLSDKWKAAIEQKELQQLIDAWGIGFWEYQVENRGHKRTSQLIMQPPFRIFDINNNWMRRRSRLRAGGIRRRNAIDGFSESPESWIENEARNLEHLTTGLWKWFEGVEYQRATRLEPRRTYSRSNANARAAAITGRKSLEQLVDSEEKRDKLNAALKEIVGVELEIESLKLYSPKTKKVTEETNQFVVRVRNPHCKQSLALPDVGFGISQLIPLLTYALTPGTLIVEEPESNLHPTAQAKVLEQIVRGIVDEKEHSSQQADLFEKKSRRHLRRLDTICEGPAMIMETHSEHILRRLLQLIEDDSVNITDEDVSIIYVRNVDGRTVAKRLRTIDGELDESIQRDFLGNNPTRSII